MPSNVGRITTDDGSYTTATAAGRLYRWFRERSGVWFSGVEMDVNHFHEHNCRAASTRKSEIDQQVDPRVEWIEHENRAGLHYYRHIFTRGQAPAAASRRLTEILQGEGYPVRGLGVKTQGGLHARPIRARKTEQAKRPPLRERSPSLVDGAGQHYIF